MQIYGVHLFFFKLKMKVHIHPCQRRRHQLPPLIFFESSSICAPGFTKECVIQAKSGGPMVLAQCFLMRADILASLSFIVTASTYSCTFVDLLVGSKNQRRIIHVHVHR